MTFVFLGIFTSEKQTSLSSHSANLMGRAINLLNIKDRIKMLQIHDHRRYKAERHHCVKTVIRHTSQQQREFKFNFHF